MCCQRQNHQSLKSEGGKKDEIYLGKYGMALGVGMKAE